MMRILSVLLILFCLQNLVACVTETTYAESGERVIKRETKPSEIAHNRVALGLRYLKAGNYSQAKYNLDLALQHQPEMPEVHYSLAYYYQVVNEFDNADKAYLRVLEIDPTNGDALNNYGAFLCQNQKIEQAEIYFLKALEQDAYIRESQTYLNLGVCMLENNKRDKALVYLARALDHDPYNGKALLELAELSMSTSEYEQARNYIKRYEKSSRLTPRSLWLGFQIESKLNDDLAAEKYGKTLVRYHPNSSQTKAYIELTR
ncbi:type IV pilus biogenesis/stability protein PilW [Algibacillus agarilyticus]|uniref:type IV pilus biogenesis/stability protein PilW n=1 Tax=Algibacillus agarilyticus TaxID=2234133 RepID=UPI000DD0B069|nr:type IV pilus biogenesis/stability protein PilW [Algibacillus agarilyticus]